MKIAIIAVTCLYLAINFAIAKLADARQMKKRYITGQCVIGKITANIFYAPAWLLKGIKFVVNAAVK